MNFKSLADKREKFSIRKYKSIGAASAVVGILFLAGGRVQAAETVAVDSNDKPKDETVNDKIETTKPLTIELQPKASEVAITETAANLVENERASVSTVEKDQPTDKFKMTFRRASDEASNTNTAAESTGSKPAESRAVNDVSVTAEPTTETESKPAESNTERSADSSTAQPTRSRRGKRDAPTDNRVLEVYVNGKKKEILVSGLETVESLDYTVNSNPLTTNDDDIYNNQILKLEKIDGATSGNQRYRLTLKDGDAIPEGGKIVFAGFGVNPVVSTSLYVGAEKVGTVTNGIHGLGANHAKERLDATTKIDDYINIFEGLEYYDLRSSNLTLTFNKNFEKYDRNRSIEFETQDDGLHYIDVDLNVRSDVEGFPDSKGHTHNSLLGKKIASVLLNPYDSSKLMTAGSARIFVSKHSVRSSLVRSNEVRASSQFTAVAKPFYFDDVYVGAMGDIRIIAADPNASEPVLKAGDTFKTTLSDNSLFVTNSAYAIGDIVSLDVSHESSNEPNVTGNRFTDSDKYVMTRPPEKITRSKSKARFELVEKTDRGYTWKLLDDVYAVNSMLYINTDDLNKISLRSDWIERFGLDNLKRYMSNSDQSISSFDTKDSLLSTITYNIKGVETNTTRVSYIRKNVNLTFAESSTGSIKVVHKTDTGVILKEASTVVDTQPWYTAVNIDPQHFDGYQFKSSSEALSTIAGKDERTIELIYTQPKTITKETPPKVTYVVDDSKEGTYRNEVAGRSTVTTTRTDYIYSPETRTAAPKDTVTVTEGAPTVITLGSKPTTEVVYEDFNTHYVADPNRAAGEKFTETEGVRGTTTTETTYSVNTETGVVTPTEGQPQVVDPTPKIIKIGTKPATDVVSIPKDTIYQADPDAAYESRTTVIAGQDGSTTTTTTYTLNEQTGEVTPATTVDTVEKVDTVIKIGNARTEMETLPKTTRYEANSDIEFEKKELQVEGRDGEILAKYTYTVSPTDGSLSNPVRSADERVVGDMLPDVYWVGNKKQERRETAITTRYESDPEKPSGEREVVSQGVLGVHTTTTLYTVNEATGDLSDPRVSETDVSMEPKVVRVGTKPKVEYLGRGTDIVRKTTTYMVNSETGFISENVKEEINPEVNMHFYFVYSVRDENDDKLDNEHRHYKGIVLKEEEYIPKDGKWLANYTLHGNDNKNITGVVKWPGDTDRFEYNGEIYKVVGSSAEHIIAGLDSNDDERNNYERDSKIWHEGHDTRLFYGSFASSDAPQSMRDYAALNELGLAKDGNVVKAFLYVAAVRGSYTQTFIDEDKAKAHENDENYNPENYSIKDKYFSGYHKLTEDFVLPKAPRYIQKDNKIYKLSSHSEEPTIKKYEDGDFFTEYRYKALHENTTHEEIIKVEPKNIYVRDESRDRTSENIIINGTPGMTRTVTTYKVDNDGNLTEEVTTLEKTEVVNTVVKVAAKDKVVFSKDGNKVVKTTTTYTVDPTNGNVSETSAKETISEDGAKDKVVTETLASPVRFEKDDQRARGEEDVRTEGRTGTKVTTTTYEVNPNTGELIPTTHEPVITPATETVVKVAAKSKSDVVRRDGKIYNHITIYTVNESTGTVTSNEHDELLMDAIQPPVHEIPEYAEHVASNDSDDDGNTIPSAVHEIPEYTEPVGSNDSDGEGNTIPVPIVEILDFNGGAAPNNAPIHEIPEYTDPIDGNGLDGEGNTITPPTAEIPEYTDHIGMNPDDASIHEVPEFEGGVNPVDVPVHEVPEFKGGVVPNEAPVQEVPEFKGSVTPNEAPVAEKPEAKIPEEPKTEQNTPAKEQADAGKPTKPQLPNTGSTDNSAAFVVGLLSVTSALGLVLTKFRRKESN